jgi:hypothetical protein
VTAATWGWTALGPIGGLLPDDFPQPYLRIVWRHRFVAQRLDGLKDRPRCPPPREYHADIQARLLVLACQAPAEVDPTRVGQTHWTIQDLAQYVAAHPELGLGHPSKSTIGVILKRHQVRLDRL